MIKRIDFNEGLKLFSESSLEELKEKAQEMRFFKNPKREVTFVLDTNPNYTNVCNADCSFCAFYRKDSAKDAYTKSIEQCLEHFEMARKAGLTTVMMQGGLNDKLKIDFYVELMRAIKKSYPDIFPHCFTAPELWNVARVSNISIEEVLQKLWDAGARTLPGGGAEILSERVRLAISPKKMEPNAWIDLHRAAHKIGYRSTATMMYGHIEEPFDIVTHLDNLRQLQDEMGGFTAFIPWSYKRDRTLLRRTVKNWAGKDAYIRMIAFSRIYLDNFDHIQGSWFSEGKEVGIESLKSGADDFGGTCVEENVHRATGFIHKVNHNQVLGMIRESGFKPIQRNPLYEVLKTYGDDEWVEIPEEQKRLTSEENKLAILG
jgi:menaquinone biosynthesis protein, SCO4550 family